MAKITRELPPINPVTGQPFVDTRTQYTSQGTASQQMGFGSPIFSDVDLSEFQRLIPTPILTGDDAADYARLTEQRAQNQTALEQWRNGVVKYAAKSALYTAGSLAMIPATIKTLLGQTADIFIPGDVVKWRDIYDNDFQRATDNAANWLDKNLPNYLTKAEMERSLVGQMGTANFWANDFLGGMAFMTGAILSEMLASSITAATLGAGSGAQTAVTQGILARAAKVMKQLHKGSTFDDVIRAYEPLGKSGQLFKGINGVRSFFTGAGYEAGVEARHFLNEAEGDLINQFHEVNGRAPDDAELADIRAKTTAIANGVFATNLALVGTSNALLFAKTFAPVRNLFKQGRKAITGAEAARITDGLFPMVDKVGDKLVARELSKSERYLRAAYKGLRNPFIEGVYEEGLQGVTSSSALDYVMQKYSPEGGDATYTLAEALQKGFEEAYGTKEGQKEVLIGALMGLLGDPITKFQGGGIKEAIDTYRQGNPYKAIADRYNNYGTLPTVSAYVRSMNRGFVLNQKQGEAIDNRDIFQAKNREDDDIFNMLSARHDTGYLDQVLDDFDAGVQDYLASSEEDGYKKLALDMGFDANTSVQEMKDRLKEVRGALQDRITTFKKANETAENILLVDDREVKEGLTYTLYNLDRLDERTKSLGAEIQRTVGDVDLRQLNDVRNANLSILFSRNWKKTFDSERGNLVDQLDTMEGDLAQARKEFDTEMKKQTKEYASPGRTNRDRAFEKALQDLTEFEASGNEFNQILGVLSKRSDVKNVSASLQRYINTRVQLMGILRKPMTGAEIDAWQTRFNKLQDDVAVMMSKLSSSVEAGELDKIYKQLEKSIFDDAEVLSKLNTRLQEATTNLVIGKAQQKQKAGEKILTALEMINAQESGIVPAIMDLEDRIVKLEERIEKQRALIAKKLAKELQDRKGANVPFDIDSDTFRANVDSAMELRKKINKHYKTDRVNAKKIEELFNDLHRLDAYRQRMVAEYNLLVDEKGQSRFKENVEQLRSQAAREYAKRRESEERKLANLISNQTKFKKLVRKLYGKYSEETKEKVVKFLSDSLSVEENVLLAFAQQGPETLDALIEQSSKVAPGQVYMSNLYKNLGAALMAGRQATEAPAPTPAPAAQEGAATTATPPPVADESREVGENEGTPMSFPAGTATPPPATPGAPPVSPSATPPESFESGVTEGGLVPTSFKAGTEAPAESFEAGTTATPPESFESGVAAPPMSFESGVAAPPTSFEAGTDTELDTFEDAHTQKEEEAVIHSPGQMLWLWNKYDEATDDALEEIGVREYPEETRDAMQEWQKNPDFNNLKLIIEEWNPATEGVLLTQPTQANPKVSIRNTVFINGKHYRVRLQVRKNALDNWHEVGSLLDPNRFIHTLTGKPLDLANPSDRAMLNEKFRDSEQGTRIASYQRKLNNGLWKWVRNQIGANPDGVTTLEGLPLQQRFSRAGISSVNMFSFKTVPPATVLERQKNFGGQTVVDKYPFETYGRELETSDGKKVKGIIYINKHDSDKPSYKIMYFDSTGQRQLSDPSDAQLKTLKEEYKELLKDKRTGKAFTKEERVILFSYSGGNMWSAVTDNIADEADYAHVNTKLREALVPDENGLTPYSNVVFPAGKRGQKIFILDKTQEGQEEENPDIFLTVTAKHKGKMLNGVRGDIAIFVRKITDKELTRLGYTTASELEGKSRPSTIGVVQMSVKIPARHYPASMKVAGDVFINVEIRPAKNGGFYVSLMSDNRVPSLNGEWNKISVHESIDSNEFFADIDFADMLRAITSNEDGKPSKIQQLIKAKYGLDIIKPLGVKQGTNKGTNLHTFDSLPLLVPGAVANISLKEDADYTSKSPESNLSMLEKTGITKEVVKEMDGGIVTVDDTRVEEEELTTIVEDETPLDTPKIAAPPTVRATPAIAPDTPAPPVSGVISDFQQETGVDDDIPFKITNLPPEEVTKFEEAKANLQRILNVPVEDIDKVMRRIANKGLTVGAFMNGVVYLTRNNMPKGTEWHEAFHVVFRTFLSNEEIRRYLYLARERYGAVDKATLDKFKAQSKSRANLTASQLEDLWYEEKMADDFMSYKNEGRQYSRKQPSTNVFVRLWNRLMEWLGLYSNHIDEIEALFSDIDLGKFKNASPLYNVYNFRGDAAFLNFPTEVIRANGSRAVDTRNRLTSTDIRMISALVFEQLRPKGVERPNKEHVRVALQTVKEKFGYDRWLSVQVPATKQTSFWSRLSSIHNALSSPTEPTWIYSAKNNEIVPIVWKDYSALDDKGVALMQAAFEENLSAIVKEIELLQSIYTKDAFEWEGLQNEEDENDSDSKERWDKLSDTIGGIDSAPAEFRKYLLTTFGKMDYFELGLSDNQLKSEQYGDLFRFPANPVILYNGILAGMRDNLRKDVMRRFVQWSQDNPHSKLLKEKLFFDIRKELAESGTVVPVEKMDDFMSDPANVPTLERGSNTYNMFVLAFHNLENMYMDARIDPASGKKSTKVIISNANNEDAAAQQLKRWMAAMSVRQNQVDVKFFGKNSYVTGVLAKVEEFITEYDGTKTQRTVQDIRDEMDNIGISLSPAYVKYSLIRNGKVQLDPQISDAGLVEFDTIYEDVQEPGLLEHLEGMRLAAQQAETVIAYTTEESGAQGRLMQIAAANARFDETLVRTSIRNSNGESVYPISPPSFMSTLAMLYKSRSRRPFIDALRKLHEKPGKKNEDAAYKLYKQLLAKDLGLEEYLSRKYFNNIKNNPLLIGITQNGYDNVMSDRFLKYFVSYNLFGARLAAIEEGGEEMDFQLTELAKNAGITGSADYVDLDNFSKNVLKISLFVDSGYGVNRAYTKRAPNGEMKPVVPFRLFVPAVLSDKKTAKAYAAPVLNVVTPDGKSLNPLGFKLFMSHFNREVDNIRNAREEVREIVNGDKTTGLVDNYHYVNVGDSRVTFLDGKFYTLTPVYTTNELGVTQLDRIESEEIKLDEKGAKKVKAQMRSLHFFDMKVLGEVESMEEDAYYGRKIDEKLVKQYAMQHMTDRFHKFVASLMEGNNGVMPAIFDTANNPALKTLEGKMEFFKSQGSQDIKDFFKALNKVVCK